MSDKRELSGWLAPNGDFTPVFWGGHDKMSEQLCSMLGLEEFFLPDEELIKRGWLRISYITLKGGPIINIGMRETTHFTESQKNFLRPYFEDKEHYEFFAYLYAIWEEENEH